MITLVGLKDAYRLSTQSITAEGADDSGGKKKSNEFLFIFVLISKLILVTYDTFHVHMAMAMAMAMAMCWDHNTARVIPSFNNLVQA